MTVHDMRDEVEAWCAGRSWVWRAPILVWLAWIGLRHLADPLHDSLFGALNLGVHEAGHLLFSWLPGRFLTVAGGTALQLAAPVMAAVMFLRQPDYFAVPVCGAWLAMNLYNVAAYMADARAQVLPLVTVGDGGCVDCHDWAYLLGTMGLLRLDTALASLTRVLAFLVMWSSLAVGAWMLTKMAALDSRT
jgi:hypothetical protein